LVWLVGTAGLSCGTGVADTRPDWAARIKPKGPVVNVRECGARGDGVANDSAAFREAARRITQGGGGTLVIPRGVYVVGEQVHEPGAYPYYKPQPIFALQGLDGVAVEGNDATLRAAPGLRFGSFDKDTGAPYVHTNGYFVDYRYAASAYWGMLGFRDCTNVAIRNLELDGNSTNLVLGGSYGDTGRQLAAYGLYLYGNRDVLVENVRTHHHGLDGIIVGYQGLGTNDPPTPHLLRRVVSEYNARQGLSWVGGRGLTVVDSKFNHTGRGGFCSAPGAGLDIEAEESVCRDGLFVNCEFANNVGCGVVADSGDGGYTRFIDCTMWGTTAWSVWVGKPGVSFEDCRIYGSAVHGYGATNAALATRYVRCRFEDKEYGTNGVYRSGGGLVESCGGDNILFDGCAFMANRTRSFWIDGTETREILRNCVVKHRAVRSSRDFQALIRGAVLENVRFEEDFLAGHSNRYFIAAGNVSVGDNVSVAGPYCKWANWSWGTTGVVTLTGNTTTTGTAFYVEAEGLDVKRGWEVIRGTEGYFPATPNLWSADRLRARAGKHGASASTTVAIPQDGVYDLWVRYESAYGFDVSMMVSLTQAGRMAASATLGKREQSKYFPFGRGWQVQGPWNWHNTDYVYQKVRAFLRRGPATITLQSVPGDTPEADRIVDGLVLTGDTTAEPGDDWGGATASGKPSFLARFKRPVYCQVKVADTATAPAVVRLQSQLSSIGYYRWEKSTWWFGADGLTNACPATGLAPGTETAWVPADCYSALPALLTATSSQPAELRISRSPDGRDAATFAIGPEPVAILASTGNTRYEREMLGARPAIEPKDYLERLTGELERYQVPGKPARKIGLLSEFRATALGFDFRRLAAACGLNGQHYGADAAVYGPDGDRFGFNRGVIYPSEQNYNLDRSCYEGDYTQLRQQYERDAQVLRDKGLGAVPRDIKLIEETGPPPLATLREWPAINAKFRAYLRECQAELAALGTNVILGAGTPEEARANPALFYHSHYFRSRLFADNCAAATRLAEEVFGPGTRLNSGSIFPSVGFSPVLDRGEEPFMLFARRGVTSYSSETTWGQGGTPDYLGPQTESYGAALGRALNKYAQGTLGNYLISDGDRGYTPAYIELASYAMAAQGFDWWSYYTLAYPLECNFMGYPELFKAIKRVSRTLGVVEDRLVPAEVVPAKVALGWSITTDIWDLSRPRKDDMVPGNCVYPQERHNLYLLLRHAQIPVDLLGEEDLTSGYLDNYKAYVLVGDHLTRAAAQAIRAWVGRGGYLIAVAGGGLRDEYDRPLEVLNDVFGIKGAELRKQAEALRPKLELIHAQPLDEIRLTGAGQRGCLPVYGYRQSFHPAQGRVLGVFTDGEAAVVANRFEQGRALIIGTLPGAAYLAGAFPQRPYGRGGDDLSQCLFPDYNRKARDFVTRLVEPDPAWSPVQCDNPLVEAHLLQVPGTQQTCVTLVNFSGKPIKSLTVTMRPEAVGSAGEWQASFAASRQKTRNGEIHVQLPLDRFEVLSALCRP
jgi:hypothetical protein